MGYEMNWASFNVIEVMSSQKFAYKRIAYVAACQSFKPETEVLMLATNLIKKDLASANMFDTSLALNGLANFLTPDLARDLSADVVALLNNSRPYIRKKAVLTLYKIFLKFPDALRPAFPRLKEKLEDPDPSKPILTSPFPQFSKSQKIPILIKMFSAFFLFFNKVSCRLPSM